MADDKENRIDMDDNTENIPPEGTEGKQPQKGRHLLPY
jgi:hypothetical protein